MGVEAQILPYISSANISCGLHAGDAATIRETIAACQAHTVAIGAHPSLDDRDHFGRREIILSDQALSGLLRRQLLTFLEWAKVLGAAVRHVKPHGALYNMSARDRRVAMIVAETIAGIDPGLILFGLSGSQSILAGREAGLPVAEEAFADRTYQPDGGLTPRSGPDALLANVDDAVAQVLQLIEEGTARATNGQVVQVAADTICLHGDGAQAVVLAPAIHAALQARHIHLCPPSLRLSKT